jgi:hypothetical protein
MVYTFDGSLSGQTSYLYPLGPDLIVPASITRKEHMYQHGVPGGMSGIGLSIVYDSSL